MCEVVADLLTTAGIKVPVKTQFFTRTNKARRSTAGAGYKEPLPRAGSFTSSIALLVHSSLNGDGPVLTGGFPFLSDLRFPGGIIIIKQQSV
ncbi:hypothetical protein T05_5481 [Trichinella murrelli]|uniref:Uncharacterized protein n=1 Tax=Trichinella murrelli TaxID=144512 RepID=A0A0V0UIH2_9BILA|nr:hypothetical protein T05_5481 [Trichinella murrelli]